MTTKTAVILTNWDGNSVVHELVSLLNSDSTTQVFVALPSAYVEREKSRLTKQFGAGKIKVLPFNPGNKAECHEASKLLLESLSSVDLIDHLVIDWHGSLPGEYLTITDSGLMKMAEYKLLGNFILLDYLLKSKKLSKGSRVVIAGSEAVRGIEDLKFPIPNIGNTVESVGTILDGSSFKDKVLDKEIPVCNIIYAHMEAILSLYIAALARRNKNVYFVGLSPGFTQDSLNTEVGMDNSWSGIILVYVLKLMFPLLKKSGVGKDYTEASREFYYAALGGDEWKFTSGSMVGVGEGGVVGTLDDISTFNDGAYLSEKNLQDNAFKALRKYF